MANATFSSSAKRGSLIIPKAQGYPPESGGSGVQRSVASRFVYHPLNALVETGATVFAAAVARRSASCPDVNDDNHVYNSLLVTPDGMNVFFAAGATVKGYRTHTVVPHTPSPTEAPIPSPVMPTPSPTLGDGGISTL